jgi:DNA-binding MarR family transcriptional regulator
MDELNKQAYIFGSIFTLANRLQILGDKIDDKITVKQWLLLASITKHNHAPTISEVSNMIGNSRQNVKKMAIILEREGFLTLTKDKSDARIIRIQLTETCMKHFKNREEIELTFIRDLFQGIDSKLLASLYEGIGKLSINIKEMENKDEKEKE